MLKSNARQIAGISIHREQSEFGRKLLSITFPTWYPDEQWKFVDWQQNVCHLQEVSLSLVPENERYCQSPQCCFQIALERWRVHGSVYSHFGSKSLWCLQEVASCEGTEDLLAERQSQVEGLKDRSQVIKSFSKKDPWSDKGRLSTGRQH